MPMIMMQIKLYVKLLKENQNVLKVTLSLTFDLIV